MCDFWICCIFCTKNILSLSLRSALLNFHITKSHPFSSLCKLFAIRHLQNHNFIFWQPSWLLLKFKKRLKKTEKGFFLHARFVWVNICATNYKKYIVQYLNLLYCNSVVVLTHFQIFLAYNDVQDSRVGWNMDFLWICVAIIFRDKHNCCTFDPLKIIFLYSFKEGSLYNFFFHFANHYIKECSVDYSINIKLDNHPTLMSTI